MRGVERAPDRAHPGADGERDGRGPRRVVVLVLLVWLSALAIACAAAGAQHWTREAAWSPAWAFGVLAVGFLLTEVSVVHLHFGGNSFTFSLVELPLAFGLFFASPPVLLAAQFFGCALALVFVRRQAVLKVVFNLGQFFFSTVFIVVAFRAVSSRIGPESPVRFVAGTAALLANPILTALLVFAVISTVTGSWQRSVLRTGLGATLATSMLTISLGVIGAIVFGVSPWLSWLIAIPMAGIYLANWAFTAQQRRTDGLAFLYQFTSGLTGSTELDSTLRSVLSQTAKVLGATNASIVLLGDPDVRFTLRDETLELPRHGDEVWRTTIEQGNPVHIVRSAHRPSPYLDANSMKDLMAVPLVHRDEVIGALVVTDRLGDAASFDSEDLALFSTMANQTTMTLENLRLIDRLRDESAERRHQALHDELTGLPNRAHLYDTLDVRIKDTPVAIAMVDLDRFKEVNDTFGHHAGDDVLVITARRLRRALPASALIARLGGDEFAIVLFGIEHPRDAVQKLRALELAITQPIDLGPMPVRIDASIGVAVSSWHGEDRTTLLRNADVAMYAAKRDRGTTIRVYDRSQERSSKRALELVGELRRAIDDDLLDVVFQPKARLSDRRVVSAEALVRWTHPTFGIVHPDEFIPLAEQAGIIDALTTVVLRRALRACASWREAGYDLGVAVNVDAQTLISKQFAETVEAALHVSALEPSSLTIEITERDLVRELDTATAVIDQLRAAGVALSIDDFGTGYSSLSYLGILPVDEIKIDRSFVVDIISSPVHRSIIEAITGVARSLGATTVVEGVEDEATWACIATLGCDSAQGYHLAHPMAAADFLVWLAGRDASASERRRGDDLISSAGS